MSGGVKSGLIFSLAGLIVVAGFSFIPLIGAVCCGPVLALTIGAIAGFLGVRWSGTPRISQGVLAGGIAGIGSLLGAFLFVMAAIVLLRSNPELYNEVIGDALRQQPQTELTPQDMDTMMNVGIVIVGLCLGVIELFITLGGGALGGWLAARNQMPAETPPPAPPPIIPVG